MGLSPSCQEKNQRKKIRRSNPDFQEFLSAIFILFGEERQRGFSFAL
jgi:hypothetical protein